MCLAMACRVIGSRAARSVAVAGPAEASAARMARRLGSARATKTCSAIASRSRSASRSEAAWSGGIEVGDQLAELAAPALDVAVERLLVRVVRQLREARLDHREPGAGAGRLQGELHVRPARVVLGQAVDVPGEAEHRRLLDPLDPHVGDVALGPGHPGRAAGAQVDRGLVAEPRAEALG